MKATGIVRRVDDLAMTDTRKDTLTRAIKKQQTIFLTHLLRWLPVSAIMGIT